MASGKDSAPQPRPSARVCLGVITKAHGVGGEVRIKSFTEDPAAVAAYGPVTDETGDHAMILQVVRVSKGVVTARIEGVDDRAAAEALKGRRLYVPREALPETEEEEFYHCDLTGLRAELVTGGMLGTVRAIHNFGAGDVLEVEGRDGAGLVVPFTRAVVPVIDTAAGVLKIDPPAGLLEPGATAPGDGQSKAARGGRGASKARRRAR
ncbi:MAG: ribosome maturation factor RimM [Alphaproteobacteria bacterium]